MRTTMERQQTCIDESTEFLCPTCGTSAFEVIGTQRNCGDRTPAAEFLIVQCLVCLEQFHHPLGTQEPCWTGAEAAEVGSVIASLPGGLSDRSA